MTVTGASGETLTEWLAGSVLILATGAGGVLCLAFPVHPPGKPEKSRLDELDGVKAPTLVVQGESDPFGMPPEGANRRVVAVRGNHSLKSDLDSVAAAARDWLEATLSG